MAGKPYIDLYVGDWKKDPNVQTLTLEEKGAWIEILMLMHESEYRGKLLIRGEPMPFEILAGLLRIDKDKAEQIVSRLIATGVADFDGDPMVLYNRRMVREEEIHRNKSKAGHLGGIAKALAEEERKASKGDSKNLAPIDIDSDNDTETVTRKRKERRLYRYTDEFELAWGIYPSRGDHSNPKRSASDQWERRLKEGVPVAHLMEAVKAYGRECHGNHDYGTEKVMQARTFFGPNARWEEYHEKYIKEQERAEKAAIPDPPAKELTEEERAEGVKYIREAKHKLKEHRHGKTDNDSGDEG